MIDVFSDVHLDEFPFRRANDFVKEILPQRPAPLLCFQGDFGYINEQNLEFLHELSRHYDRILFVLGNNDTKIYTNHPEGYIDAEERVKAFLYEIESHIPNALYLNGRTLTYGGMTFGGSDIYYDFTSIQQQFGVSKEAVLAEWHRRHLHLKHKGYIDDPLKHAEQQKARLCEIIPTVDVIITHAPPNYFLTPSDKVNGFFRFEASRFIPQITSKTWLFGHQHTRRDEFLHGCHFVNATYAGSGKGIQQIQVLPQLSTK